MQAIINLPARAGRRSAFIKRFIGESTTNENVYSLVFLKFPTMDYELREINNSSSVEHLEFLFARHTP
jgi:hypothetical protein